MGILIILILHSAFRETGYISPMLGAGTDPPGTAFNFGLTLERLVDQHNFRTSVIGYRKLICSLPDTSSQTSNAYIVFQTIIIRLTKL